MSPAESSRTHPTAGAPADVIHDIGFRHYDGPRFGRGWIVRSLLADTVRGVFGLGRPARSKVMPWVLVGILLLPPLVVVLVAVVTGMGQLPVTYTGYLGALQLVIGLFVAGAAPYCVSRDLRHGVMSLYLSRPLRRGDYVLARFGGLSIALLLVLVTPQTLLLVGALLAELDAGPQLRGWAGGLAASVVLALLLAALGLVIAAFTPRRGLGVAAIITTLLVLSGFSYALSGIAETRDRSDLARYAGVLDPFRLVDGLAVRVLGVEPGTGFPPPEGAGVLVFVLAWMLVTAGGVAVLLRRYRRVGGL